MRRRSFAGRGRQGCRPSAPAPAAPAPTSAARLGPLGDGFRGRRVGRLGLCGIGLGDGLDRRSGRRSARELALAVPVRLPIVGAELRNGGESSEEVVVVPGDNTAGQGTIAGTGDDLGDGTPFGICLEAGGDDENWAVWVNSFLGI